MRSMNRTIASLIALSLPLGCALRHPTAPTQTRIGPVASFGRGIVESQPRWVTFNLDIAAYVIAVRVTDPASIYRFRAYIVRDCLWRPTPQFREMLRRGCGPAIIDLPERFSGERLLQPGTHRLQAWGPYYRTGYWVLIASDTRTSLNNLLYANVTAEDGDTSLVYLANRIPAALIANRTRHWVAYVAPFGDEDVRDIASESR